MWLTGHQALLVNETIFLMYIFLCVYNIERFAPRGLSKIDVEKREKVLDNAIHLLHHALLCSLDAARAS